MAETIEKLTEGDIFRWTYRDPNTDARQYGSYHCCSRIAIVHGGLIRDTFWQIGMSFSEGRTFGPDDLHKIELTRLGNLSEFDPAREYEADYYDDADIVDINHSNSSRGNFYLRKGAKRSQEKMLSVARQRAAEAESDWHTATRRMHEIKDIIARIEIGIIDMHIPSWRS